MTQGVGSFWGGEAAWEVVEEVVDRGTTRLVPAVMVRVTFVGDDRPLWVVCEPGDPPRPLCRHEHLYPGSVFCPEQRAARDELDRLERVRRMGLLPAPEGARYVTHCEAYWPARHGGACPTCGATGDVLTPVAKLEHAKNLRGWWLTTDRVDVVSALADAGLGDARGVRVLEHTAALVHYVDLPAVLPPSIGGYISARLEASGWKASAGGRRKGAA